MKGGLRRMIFKHPKTATTFFVDEENLEKIYEEANKKFPHVVFFKDSKQSKLGYRHVPESKINLEVEEFLYQRGGIKTY